MTQFGLVNIVCTGKRDFRRRLIITMTGTALLLSLMCITAGRKDVSQLPVVVPNQAITNESWLVWSLAG